MIVRIVKMTFDPSQVEAFQEIFHSGKETIQDFDGCHYLELYCDKGNKNIFFTYSYWEDEQALENYRNSDFFRKVWGDTKKLFSAKPEAWSVEKVWSSGGTRTDSGIGH